MVFETSQFERPKFDCNKYYNLTNNSLSKIILVAKYCCKIVSNEDPGVRTRSAGLLFLCLLNYVPCERHLA